MLTLEARDLTKRYGALVAVDQLSFTVHPGRVTALLGPNGAGKSTTLRMMLGLAEPTSGGATVGGQPYVEIGNPAHVVGAVLDTTGAHPGLTAIRHLEAVCQAAGLPRDRAAQTLATVGLSDSAKRRVGDFSLGMKQRLALATALVGDPSVLILDEPSNGLDPAGIHWLRELLRWTADQGRTVLVSSHVLTEVQQLADDVVILDHGRLVLASPLAELRDSLTGAVRVRSATIEPLQSALAQEGLSALLIEPGTLRVSETTPAVVGQIALQAGVALSELVAEQAGLEDAFLRLTRNDS